ncbi:unnamed protein product [Absidia cylindrospora]
MNQSGKSGGYQGRLSKSLEFKVSKYFTQYKAQGNTDWSLVTLVDYVQKVDSSFRRLKKRQIEQTIEKVLDNFDPTLSGNEDEDELKLSEDEDEQSEYAIPAQENNAMNKSVTNLWNLHKPASAPSTPTDSMPASPAAATAAAADATGIVPTNLDGNTTVDNNNNEPNDNAGGTSGDKVESKATGKRRNKNTGSGSTKRQKAEGRDSAFIPTATLSDLGGIDQCIEEIMELIAMPLAHPEVYIHTGVQPPRGVLLHGPPGCGKTRLAHAIAGELQVPFINISAPSIVSGMSGESEKKIRDVFEDAKSNAPCLLFIDEIDAITPKRETAQREMERRIVAQLLTCMDDLSWDKTDNKPVMIIGATNRPDSLDAALRRAGRFDREISMGVPDEKAREKILTVLSGKLRLEGQFDFAELAKSTPGYVGADLQALITTAGVIAVKRIFKHLRHISLSRPQSQVVTPTHLDNTMNPDDNTTEKETDSNAMDIDEVLITKEMMDSNGVEPEQSTTTALEQAPIPIGLNEDQQTTTNDEKQLDKAIKTTSVEEFESQSALDQLRAISDFIKAHKEPLSPAQLESLAITQDDFKIALTKVQPSSKREGFATVPDVSWDDIGALQYVRDELRMAVVEPINHPEFFERVGITNPAGVLLWGPPGCGKTLLAKAVANESNTNFISVKGPELLNKYVGESERGVRQVFARARASAPCVIFFDELDALCSRRDDQQTDSSARVVNTLLTELDGAENRSQVYVIAATNRPDMIDPAMLRPGRLDKLLYVELPTPGERLDILTKLSKGTPLGSNVSLQSVADDQRCEGFSGADLASLVRESAVASLRSKFYQHGKTVLDKTATADDIFVTMENFDTAFTRVSPSVLPHDKRQYDKLRQKFG